MDRQKQIRSLNKPVGIQQAIFQTSLEEQIKLDFTKDTKDQQARLEAEIAELKAQKQA